MEAAVQQGAGHSMVELVELLVAWEAKLGPTAEKLPHQRCYLVLAAVLPEPWPFLVEGLLLRTVQQKSWVAEARVDLGLQEHQTSLARQAAWQAQVLQDCSLSKCGKRPDANQQLDHLLRRRGLLLFGALLISLGSSRLQDQLNFRHLTNVFFGADLVLLRLAQCWKVVLVHSHFWKLAWRLPRCCCCEENQVELSEQTCSSSWVRCPLQTAEESHSVPPD